MMLTKTAYKNNGGNKDIVFGRFQFVQMSTGGTAFFAISRKEDSLASDTQISENFNREFLFSIFLPGFLEFSVEWRAFRKFNNFRILGRLFKETSVAVAPVSKVPGFLVE